MNLSEILSKSGVTSFSFASVTTSAKPKQQPRQLLLQSLQNSLKLHADPSFKVKNSKGQDVAPTACYKIVGQNAEIWASYAKQRLKLNADSCVLVVPASQLKASLEAAIEVANAGAFDSQLDEIHAARSAKHKGTKSKKAV